MGAGEEVEVPPVHPSRPESRQRASSPDGLVLREAPPTAAALPAAADPQPATAALQLPHHPACPSQVSVKHDRACGVEVRMTGFVRTTLPPSFFSLFI